MTTTIRPHHLLKIASAALFTAGFAASLRAGTAGAIRAALFDATDPAGSAALIAGVLGLAFTAFALTLIVVSPLLDRLTMRGGLIAAAVAFVGGTALTCAAPMGGDVGATVLRLGVVLMGIGWGCTEATINPLIAALYPADKTKRMNQLHAWWPGGIIVGGLASTLSDRIPWPVLIALIALPAVGFGIAAWRTSFPPTEHAADGVSLGGMARELVRRPSLLVWLGAMVLTASTELAPGQWVDVALSNVVGMRGILLLVYVSALMFALRHFAGPLAHRLSSVGLLWVSCGLAAAGLFLLSRASDPASALVAATVWGAGVCFLWPTMLASVSERYPRGGTLAIGLIGAVGAGAIGFVLPRLGAIYDGARIAALTGIDPATNPVAARAADVAAAATSFSAVAVLPLILLLVFAGIWLAERRGTPSTVIGVKS